MCMQELFRVLFYQPTFNAFVALYNVIPDVGIVIVVLTVFFKLIVYPLTSISIRAQKSLADLQPKIDELKKTHKDNQQLLATATMSLYKEHKVNPFGSCLPLLLQLPIFIALYWVLHDGLTTSNFDLLYSFVRHPESIKAISLGVFDLREKSTVVALLAAGAQFWQAKMMTRNRPPVTAGKGGKDEGMASMMNKQMLYMMPLMTLIIGFQLPAGLSLYWLVSTLLTGAQQMILFKKKPQSDGTVMTV